MARNSLLLLVIVSVLAGVSAVLPLGALAGLIGAGVCCALVTGREAFPGFLLGGLVALYILVGAPNISLYRGDIDPAFLRIMVLSCFALTAGFAVGALLGGGVRPGVRSASGQGRQSGNSVLEIPDSVVFLSALPGLCGVLWVVAGVRGLPLLDPALRFAIDPRALVLVEMLLVPLILRGLSLMGAHRTSSPLLQQAELAGWFLLLAVPGYRGWLVGALGVLVLTALSSGRLTRRKVLWSGAAALVGVGVLVLFVVIRRLTQAELYDPTESLRIHGAEALPGWFAQIHFSIRESLYTAQGLWSMRTDGVGGPSLFFADLATLLPGKQQAAGAILGDFFGRSLGGGLTASLPGVLYYEAGPWAFLVLGGMGAVMGAGWSRLYRAHASRPAYALYFLIYIYLLHLFHRGTLKLAYLAVPLFLFVMIRLASRGRTGDARPVPPSRPA